MHKSIAIQLQQSTFLTSAAKLSQCPEDSGVEIAFAGRSNAGKSSAINTLTNQNKLAKVSKTPGRTRLLNYFSLSPYFRIVDLPGYGYAKVHKSIRNEWNKILDDYFSQRQSLRGLVLLMDIRHPLTDFDITMITWVQSKKIPIHILLTKADKMSFGKAKSQLLRVEKELSTQFTNVQISIQLFSSLKKQGKDGVYTFLSGFENEAKAPTTAEKN